jgi:hypothetical protein
VLQIAVNFLYLLLILDFLSKTRKLLIAIIVCLIAELAFSFAGAVWSAIEATLIDGSGDSELLRISRAETIITFIAIIPIIIVQIAYFFDRHMTLYSSSETGDGSGQNFENKNKM